MCTALFNKFHSVKKLFVSLARKADNYIARHRKLRHDAAGIFEQGEILFSRISAVHRF